eukprot:3549095-Rhodomonas_salina.1
MSLQPPVASNAATSPASMARGYTRKSAMLPTNPSEPERLLPIKARGKTMVLILCSVPDANEEIRTLCNFPLPLSVFEAAWFAPKRIGALTYRHKAMAPPSVMSLLQTCSLLTKTMSSRPRRKNISSRAAKRGVGVGSTDEQAKHGAGSWTGPGALKFELDDKAKRWTLPRAGTVPQGRHRPESTATPPRYKVHTSPLNVTATCVHTFEGKTELSWSSSRLPPSIRNVSLLVVVSKANKIDTVF